MKNINRIFKNQLLTSGLVMVLGTNLYNGGQFVFHFLIGRFLGKASYGDIAAIISILGIIVLVQMALNLTIIKFIAAEKDDNKLKDFIKWINKISIIGAVISGFIILLCSPWIINFLNITQPAAAYLLGPLVGVFILVFVTRAILQGLLKFNQYVFSMLIESFSKIVLTIIFILLGYAIIGAVGAILISAVISYLFTIRYLAPYLKGKRGPTPDIKPLLKYSSSSLLQGFALTSMYSSDLILVKHFFSPEQAGLYAALAILGRIVFFGASPVSQVMFPLIAKKHSLRENYNSIFFLSVGGVFAFTAFITAIYYFFPQLPLGTLYGKSYLDGASLLWWYGLFMSFLAVAMLLTQFYLSVQKTWTAVLFIIAALFQLVIIWLFHPSLLSVIQTSAAISALLVLVLLLYFPYHKKYGK